jgi:chemotaxis protein CheZ
MAELNFDSNIDAVGQEIRSLAENMLKELEHGDVSRAVSLVGELNQIRDRTLYNEIGRLTRALHEALKNLQIASVGSGSDITHTTDKLAYVLEMTDKSANRTMDLVDASMPLTEDIQQRATQLSGQWQKFLNKELQPAEFRVLSKDITSFLQDSASNSRKLHNQLSDIVLAQDFQDLTGQVIHKVAALAKDVESRLVQLVMMAGQVDKITGISHSDIELERPTTAEHAIVAEGPQINKASENVMTSQDDVDDLLSSLGF